MDIACVVVYSLLCVSPEYQEVTELGGMLREVDGSGNIRVLSDDAILLMGVSIEVIATDLIVYSPTSVLASVCETDRCLYYRKYCDAVLRECTYSVGAKLLQGTEEQRHLVLSKFMITYSSDEALRAAEERISVVEGGEANRMQLPVSRLEILSSTPEVIMCPPQRGRRSTIMQGC